MANKIQVKRGLKASIPALNVGEPGFTTDTKEFYIGSASGNVQLAKQADLSAHMADTAAHNGFVGKTQMFGTFDNFNDITQPGIYHGIIASPKESEPINGGTNPRRLTLTVRHIFWGENLITQELFYDDGHHAGNRYFRFNNESWRKLLTSTHEDTTISHSDGVHGLYIENGTWTPTLRGHTVAGSNSYSVREGKYKLIGNTAHVWGHLVLSAKDPAMTGLIRITGLPVASALNLYISCWCLTTALSSDVVGTEGILLYPQNQLIPRKIAGASVLEINATDITDTTQIAFYISYNF